MNSVGLLLAASLTASFAHPPKDVRPELWFHVIGGNISTNGIRADLDVIEKSGFSGIQFFHEDFGGPWPGVTVQTRCLTGNWDAYVRFVAEECRRRNLTFKMQNCPGWSMAGGPWIDSTNAMRDLVFSRTLLAGGAARPHLDRPREATDHDWRDYRDLRVLAFPSPDGDAAACLKPVSVKGPRAYPGAEHSWYTNPWARGHREPREPMLDGFELRDAWLDGFSEKGTYLGFRGEGTERFEIDFGTNVTVRTLTLTSVQEMNHAQSYVPEVTAKVEAEVGGAWRPVREVELPKSNWEDGWPISLALPETTARRFRLTLVHRHDMVFSFARFSSRAAPDNYEADAAYCLRSRLRGPHAPLARTACVDEKSVLDLTDRLRADGTLDWTAPAGRWTVLRIGHVNAGHRNGPAPKAATGWECDKLSRAGADAHYDGFIGRLAKGPLGGGLLNGLLIDSWECCSQSWTAGLDEAYRAKTGAAFPFLELCGYVVGDRETTRATLAGWRRFLSDRVANEFYGRIVERAHADGLSVAYETAGGDVFPGDILDYWRHADVPMCEFWCPRTPDFVGSHDFKPIYPCASAAHLYGKTRVDAESFTDKLTWRERLVDYVDVANVHFARGVTHSVMQAWVHDPRPDSAPPPGGSLGSNGTPLNRRQKWIGHLGEFAEFLARCTLLLERGQPVRDVLLYVGDDVDHVPPTALAFPEGYRYDYCTAHPFLTRLEAKNGAWMTPDGIRYGTLWLRDTPYLRDDTRAKMAAGAAAGSPVVTNLTAAVLPPPDVIGAGTNLVWEHRREGDVDRYFIATDGNRPWKGTLSLRATGVTSVWNPQDGSIAPLEGLTDGVRTEVTLDLKPSGCVFVVLDRTCGRGVSPRQKGKDPSDFGAACGTWYDELLADEKKPAAERKLWAYSFPHETPQKPKIRVACIGDSITWGSAMTNRTAECYPAQLQKLLGDGYVVRNFGDPGTGVYMKPHPDAGGWQPGTWRAGEQARAAYAFEPDVVIANFGINDVGNHDDELKGGKTGRPFAARGTFVREYVELLRAFRRNGKDPKFVLWTRLGPTGKRHCLYGKSWAREMEPDLNRVADEVGAAKLDMLTPLQPLVETPHFAKDAIHPEGGAQKVIAEKTAAAVTAALSAVAADRSENFKITVTTDRIDGLYPAGETATVTIAAKDKKGTLVKSGRIDVTVDNFGKASVTNLTVDFAVANPVRLKLTRPDAGFLRVNAGGTLCGVGFDVLKIAPGTPNPPDFARFWREAIAKYDREIPFAPEVRVDESLSDADWIVERIAFAAPGGRKAYGFVTRERKATGRLPGRVEIPGAGFGCWSQAPSKNAGRITLKMTVYPFEPDVKLGRRTDYEAGDKAAQTRWGVPRYCQGGISESREAYFFYPVILANNRAIDWFAARSDVDAAKIDYSGSSQGGGLGLAAMALNSHFARGCVCVPALTDLLGYRAGNRQSGWPQLVENHPAGAKEAVERNAPYFCGVNFARMIGIPIRFAVGHIDTSCSPNAVYSAFNACPSADKAILDGIGVGHGAGDYYSTYLDAWSRGSELAKPQVRFLAFNVWGDYFGNPVREREGEMVALVKRWNPDIAGFQEMTPRFWKSALVTELEKDYVFVGRGLGFEKRDAHTPILFRRMRFDLIESGIILQCPELDDSKGAAWAVLRDRSTGRKLVAFASHAWWRYDGAGDDWIRLNGAKMLSEKMHELAKRHDAAVVGGGDLNAPLESGSLKWLLAHGYADAQASAEISPRGFPTEHGDPKRGPDGRYVGRNGANGHNLVPEKFRYLDHIFYDPNRLAARRFDIDISSVACRLSDHHPIVLDFDFK